MGTSDFAATCLEALAKQTKHEICAVVSQPDRPKGRGHKLAPTPVHESADKLGLKIYQPETLKDGAFLPVLREENPDIIVVAAYGKLLPEYILNFPKYRCVNVHGSVLPRWRGAAPIQHSVLSGDRETGITIMYMEKGLDTGDMILIKKTPIGEDETSEQLFGRLAILGGEALIEALSLIEKGEVRAEKQNEEESTYAARIEKSMALIDWTKSAEEIKNLVRGMNSWPYAYTYYDGAVMKIGKVSVADKVSNDCECGTIISCGRKEGILIKCGKGAVYAQTIQFEGKKMMSVADYLSGHTIKEGLVLGK